MNGANLASPDSTSDESTRSPASPSAAGPCPWPDEAAALRERAIARHGGWERWSSLRSISVSPVSLGGPLPWLKGQGRTFHIPPRVEVFPHARLVCFGEAARPSLSPHACFVNGSIVSPGHAVSDADAPTLQGPDHRPSFAGLRKYRRWSDADAFYFFGYALVTYFGLPFILRDTAFVALRTHRASGRQIHAITVDFPPELVTHCRRQRFFFDESGLLIRHDYVADIVGSWAHGAHFSSGYQTVEGVPLATRRQVFCRLGGRATPVLVLHARLADFSVSFR